MSKLRHMLLLSTMPLLLGLCLLCGASGFGLPDLHDAAGRALFELRLTRILGGLTVGAALAGSGCALQAVLRNQLAEPYVLGISSGGSLGAALAIMTGLALLTPAALPLGAFAGAVLALLLVCRISARHGNAGAGVLILAGVVVGTMLSSLTLLLHSLDTTHRGPGLTWWMMGNLQAVAWPSLAPAMLLAAAACTALWLHSRELNALQLGDEQAGTLGVRTQVALPVILTAATLATAAAVSISGIIGFVGLVVPHALRRVIGTDHRRLLPSTFLVGGTFLVLCDTLARLLLAPREIPVGVITSLTGGPFFLYLLTRRPAPQPAHPSPIQAARQAAFQRARAPAEDSAISLRQVSATLNGQPVLQDISLDIRKGERVALIGPNGAGKSSLLRVIAGTLAASGSVRVAGFAHGTGDRRALARRLAVVPQSSPYDLPLDAHDYTMLGRTPHLPRLGGPVAADLIAVRKAMELTSTWHLRERPLARMSGGERQRLAVAMALAAQPEIMLLDEPTTHLDLRHQSELMTLLTKLNQENQITLVIVMHDLHAAARFAPRTVLLANGRILADGAPETVLRPELLQTAYFS